MGILSWIFGDSERLRFVKSVCDRIEPKISEDGWGYMFRFYLRFGDEIQVEIKYNALRYDWESRIHSYEADREIYWTTPPLLPCSCDDVSSYLIDRYKLKERLVPRLTVYNERNKRQDAAEKRVKQRYLP